jgi:hypothetical protein
MESDEQNHRLRTGICISRRSPPCIHAFDTVARQIVRVRETEGGTRRPGAVLNVVLQGRLQVASGCGFIEFRPLAMVTIGICRSKVNFWGSQVDLRGMSGQYIPNLVHFLVSLQPFQFYLSCRLLAVRVIRTCVSYLNVDPGETVI